MSKLTITEALAEISTINKRIAKKEEFVFNYLIGQEQYKDPLEKEGGSEKCIGNTRQAIGDLRDRQLILRREIRCINEETMLTVTVGTDVVTRTIADWLVWKRETAPQIRSFLDRLSTAIVKVREDAKRKGLSVITTGDVASKENDVIINLNEAELAEQRETLEEILGILDGLLSLKNATTFVTI